MPACVRYNDDVESIDANESALADKITEVMSKGAAIVRTREGRPLRSSHAKAHGLATGELTVAMDPPNELRQGVFVTPVSYPVVVRPAHVPGELLDDRKVSTPGALR